ncbi:MAG TPA: COX15/CtaA family protein [Albitalea sp.]|nr:COX15/CtaA family protein [Albitalea sp.]
MNSTERRQRLLQRMAWLCAALVLAITSLSAFLRLSKAGLGCEPWPQCYVQAGASLASGAPPSTDAATAAARLAHRIVAVAALVVVLMMVMTTLATRPPMWRAGRHALVLLALALFLAVLGRWTASARVPAVTLGNLLAGFAMFAWSVRLAQTAGPAHRPTGSSVHGWAAAGAALLVVQIALGGLVSAGHAGLACPQLAGCDASGASWQALNPWHAPAASNGGVGDASAALVHGAHRAMALLVGVVLLPVGLAAWRRGRAAGGMLVLLLVLQLALGVVLVWARLPFGAALAHNIVAALLLATAAYLTGGVRHLR